MRPTADRPAAVSLDDFFAASAASPDKTIRLASLEEMLGNIPISLLGEEPFGDGVLPPTVTQFAVDLQADGLGKSAKAVSPPWLPQCHGQRIARRNF
jgi:hypothetical protein